VLDVLETGLVDSVQVVYNVFDQAPADVLLPACGRLNVAVIARVPFDEGSLTGTIAPGTRWPEGDWRNIYFAPERLAETLRRVEKVRKIVPEGSDLPDVSLRFILRHPTVSTTIPGMRRMAHVERNVASIDAGPLDDAVCAELQSQRWDRSEIIP
jgi:aryl-alcohol dehydrogenase-like predicted oxidoreductase